MGLKDSSASLSMKQKNSKSKAELKMALVAKRLAMLQPDDDDLHYLQPVSVGHAMIEYQRSSPAECSNARRENTPVKDVFEDGPSGNELAFPVSSASEKKSRRTSISRKRLMVISDDESEEDGRNRRIKLVEPFHDLSAEKSSSAMKRAEEVRANLPPQYPTLVKEMLPSHVSGGFWLHLSTQFCKDHMPPSNCTVKLVDEVGKTSDSVYLVNKSGLSGGWKAFAKKHELSEGDVVVFQWISPRTFKVYIVRKGGQDEFDGALGLLTLDHCRGQEISEKSRGQVLSGKPKEDCAIRVLTAKNSPPRNSESPPNSSDAVGPEVLDGICFSDSTINFEDIKGFEDFSIILDGLVIDSMFSEDSRKKYYELCCSQKCFLHEHLLKGLNCKLVMGIIFETINIADAIRANASSTLTKDLRIWQKTLKGFEVLGMKVNFLRRKLDKIVGIAADLDRADESNVRPCASEKWRALESRLTMLKETMEKISSDIDAENKASTQRFRNKMKEIANAPW